LTIDKWAGCCFEKQGRRSSSDSSQLRVGRRDITSGSGDECWTARSTGEGESRSAAQWLGDLGSTTRWAWEVGGIRITVVVHGGNAVESEVSHGVVMRTRMCMVGVYGVRCDERINGGADGRSLGMIIIGMDVVVGAC